jgi:hypothetical protein
MGVTRPFKRTYRPPANGGGGGDYFFDRKYAESPEHYIRAFLLLQKDLLQIFDFVEPAKVNCRCYSYRIHELLFRACVEVEANCKAILKENGYVKANNKDLNIHDYRKINWSHHLSSYSVKLPVWHGTGSIRQPFAAWSQPLASSAPEVSLHWYTAYNSTKHDRYTTFKEASFENMVDAVSGLLVVLSAQFWIEDYSPRPAMFFLEGSEDGMEHAIGDYFRVKFPDDWPPEECYDFDWVKRRKERNRFQNYCFPI